MNADHAHHYVCELPSKGWTVGTCKHCGHIKRHWDQVDGEKGSWRDTTALSLPGSNRRRTKGRVA